MKWVRVRRAIRWDEGEEGGALLRDMLLRAVAGILPSAVRLETRKAAPAFGIFLVW